jgi:hypothetical protein
MVASCTFECSVVTSPNIFLLAPLQTRLKLCRMPYAFSFSPCDCGRHPGAPHDWVQLVFSTNVFGMVRMFGMCTPAPITNHNENLAELSNERKYSSMGH